MAIVNKTSSSNSPRFKEAIEEMFSFQKKMGM
jgi:hypothetical protein